MKIYDEKKEWVQRYPITHTFFRSIATQNWRLQFFKSPIHFTNRFHFSITTAIPYAASRQITFLSELPEAVDAVSPTRSSLPRLPPFLPLVEWAIQRRFAKLSRCLRLASVWRAKRQPTGVRGVVTLSNIWRERKARVRGILIAKTAN